MREAFDMSFWINADGTRNTTWWRTDPFEALCASEISKKTKNAETVVGTARLVRSEELKNGSRTF